MPSAYLEGLLLGLPLMFLVGPVFLTLLHASLVHGWKAGLAVSIGISLSDGFCIALCYVGLAPLLLRPTIQTLSLWLGGLFLLGFGLSLLLRRPTLPSFEAQTPSSSLSTSSLSPSLGSFALQGFLVNFVNPFVLTFWVGSLSAVSARYKASPSQILVFFAGTVSVIFVTDTLKALLADHLKQKMTPVRLLLFHRIAGVGLIVFGLRLLCPLLGFCEAPP